MSCGAGSADRATGGARGARGASGRPCTRGGPAVPAGHRRALGLYEYSLMDTIGVDLGGTKMAVGVIDGSQRITYRSTAPSIGLHQDEVLATLERGLRAALEARPDVGAIGLGIPCTI